MDKSPYAIGNTSFASARDTSIPCIMTNPQEAMSQGANMKTNKISSPASDLPLHWLELQLRMPVAV